MRRAIRVIDTGERAYPCPDNRSGDGQAFAVRELLLSVAAELESARRLVRACEQTAGTGRTRTLLGLLESLDVALVNSLILADDATELQGEVARTVRTLTLESRIQTEWTQAVAARRAG